MAGKSLVSYNWNESRCPEKAKSRDFIFKDVKGINKGIFLAGSGCEDVKKADKLGLLKNSEKIILVEKEISEFEKMKQSCPKKVPAIFINDKLENIKLEDKIDFANLDFLGGLSTPVYNWIHDELRPKIMIGATIVITQENSFRNYKKFNAQDVKTARFIRNKYPVKLWNSFEGLKNQKILLMIHGLFNGWDFDLCLTEDNEIPSHKDAIVTMLTFKLINFKKG